jgi:hypothetical protein
MWTGYSTQLAGSGRGEFFHSRMIGRRLSVGSATWSTAPAYRSRGGRARVASSRRAPVGLYLVSRTGEAPSEPWRGRMRGCGAGRRWQARGGTTTSRGVARFVPAPRLSSISRRPGGWRLQWTLYLYPNRGRCASHTFGRPTNGRADAPGSEFRLGPLRRSAARDWSGCWPVPVSSVGAHLGARWRQPQPRPRPDRGSFPLVAPTVPCACRSPRRCSPPRPTIPSSWRGSALPPPRRRCVRR